MNLVTSPLARILFGLMLIVSTLSAEEIPARLSDAAFWEIVSDYSEPDGAFSSDNFISNELSYQHVLPDLKTHSKPGGVYLGVGPEQNFTYIAAVQPQIAFIFDIRRQNMIEHLMYKALFDLSRDRQDFLSRLFSRPLSPRNSSNSSLKILLESVDMTPSDAAMYTSTLRAIRENLTQTHGFKLTGEDQVALEHVFNAFYVSGLNISYNGSTPGLFPTYRDLLLQVDPNQISDNYLSTESSFEFVQRMEKENRIVPLVADFAGSTSLRAVGDYLREHDAKVRTVYTSNVEQYLFLDPLNWKNFYRNLASFPLDSSAVMIRALIQTDKGAYSNLPTLRQDYRIETMLFAVHDLVQAFDDGDIYNYSKILNAGNLSARTGAPLIGNMADPNPNVGVVVWPNLEPPAQLTATVSSGSEIILKWPKMKQVDVTGFQISRQTSGSWSPLAHKDFASLCSSDPCSYRDSGLKADVRYCYRIQSADDYSNLPGNRGLDEDLGDPSITICAVPADQAKQ